METTGNPNLQKWLRSQSEEVHELPTSQTVTTLVTIKKEDVLVLTLLQFISLLFNNFMVYTYYWIILLYYGIYPHDIWLLIIFVNWLLREP